MSSATASAPRLLEQFRGQHAATLRKEFNYKNMMEVPQLKKVVVSVGLKEAKDDAKILDQIELELSQITGQKPLITKAKKSIATFKLREGVPVGLKVTLRGHRMYEFIDRLFNVAMPRIRDFRGSSRTGFDGNGNYTLGILEQSIFPEVQFDKIRLTKGMNVSFVTSANTDDEGRKLLELLGLPFRKNKGKE